MERPFGDGRDSAETEGSSRAIAKSRLVVVLAGILVVAVAGAAASLLLNKKERASMKTEPEVMEQADNYIIRRIESSDLTIRSIGLTQDNFPRLDGSTSTQPIRGLIACKTVDLDYRWFLSEDMEMFVGPFFGQGPTKTISFADKVSRTNSKTHQAYLNLINGKNDMILVSTKPSADELKAAKDRGVKLELTPIGLDGFVFLVNAKNPIKGLTTADIVDFYTRKVVNWKKFSGKDSPIAPFIRPENSGSQELMKKLIMKSVPIDPGLPQEHIIGMMSALIDGVQSHENSIGYSLYYYKTTMIDKRNELGLDNPPEDQVRLIALDGVEPNTETIASRKYPYIFYIYAVTRGDQPKNSTAYKLKKWLMSDEGQDVIEEAGYVGLGD